MRLLNRYRVLLNVTRNFSTNPKPLVVLLPWLGAKQKGINKYKDLYHNHGCDVIVHQSHLKDFLWPKSGIKNSLIFLNHINENNSGQPIVIHSFSIGCYFYALMLMHMNEKGGQFGIKSRIVGQVFDSPVIGSLNEMAIGVSKMIAQKEITRTLLKNFCLAYFAVSRPYTVRFYDLSLDHITNKPIVSPALFLSSLDDPMFQEQSLKNFEETWSKNGCATTMKIWESSEHAQHLRKHPEEYKSLLENFLKSLPL